MSRRSYLNWGIFLGSRAVAEGVLTPEELRSRWWRELRPDVFVDARLPLDHAVACHGVALALPDGFCFSGPSAAYLLGVLHAATFEDEVHVTVPPERSVARLAGVRIHKTPLPREDTAWIDALPITSAVRTAWDLASALPTQDSVPIIDALLGLALVTPAELYGYADRRLSRRGGRSAQRAFALADGRARTPEASRLRLAVLAAGLPPPTPYHPITLANEVRTPELAWPEQRVGVAYPSDHTRYSDVDWVVLRIDPDTMDTALPGVLRDLRSALLGRGWQGPRS